MMNKYYSLKEFLELERRTVERKKLLAEIYDVETEIMKSAYIKAVKQNYSQSFLNKLSNEINSEDRDPEVTKEAIEIFRIYR